MRRHMRAWASRTDLSGVVCVVLSHENIVEFSPHRDHVEKLIKNLFF